MCMGLLAPRVRLGCVCGVRRGSSPLGGQGATQLHTTVPGHVRRLPSFPCWRLLYPLGLGLGLGGGGGGGGGGGCACAFCVCVCTAVLCTRQQEDVCVVVCVVMCVVVCVWCVWLCVWCVCVFACARVCAWRVNAGDTHTHQWVTLPPFCHACQEVARTCEWCLRYNYRNPGLLDAKVHWDDINDPGVLVGGPTEQHTASSHPACHVSDMHCCSTSSRARMFSSFHLSLHPPPLLPDHFEINVSVCFNHYTFYEWTLQRWM